MTIGRAASVLLGIAFLVAGGAKIAAGREWPEQARALGAPSASIVVLPWIEIVLGALLCVRLAVPIPALAALGLLASFTVLIVVRLAQGRRPPCACFGSWSARPLGWRHVARNAALIAVALVAMLA